MPIVGTSEDKGIDTPRAIVPIQDESFKQLWSTLSVTQRRYVAHRMTTSTDAEAARAAGIPEPTIRTWRNKADVAKAVVMLTEDALNTVMDIRRGLLVKALAVMGDALDSTDERIRLAAAQDIADRGEGKAVQRIAPINPDGTAYSPGTSQEQQEAQDRRLLEILEAARIRRLEAQSRQAAQDSTGEIVEAQDVRITVLPIDTPTTDKAALEGKE